MNLETKKFTEKNLRIFRSMTYYLRIREYPNYYSADQEDSDEIGDIFYKCELCGLIFDELELGVSHMKKEMKNNGI